MKYFLSRNIFVFTLVSMLTAAAIPATAQENWIQTNGPFGGSFNDISMWSDSGLAIGFRTYFTPDDGRSWQRRFQVSMDCGVVDTGGLAWLGLYPHLSGGAEINTVFTRDYGATWQYVDTNSEEGYEDTWKIITTSPGHRVSFSGHIVAVASCDSPNDSVWKSVPTVDFPPRTRGTDALYNPVTGAFLMGIIDFTDTLYRVYRSTNKGANWTSLAFDGVLPTQQVDRYAYPTPVGCALSMTSSGIAFLSVVQPAGSQKNARLFRSTDDGTSWTEVINIPPFTQILSIIRTPNGTLFGAEYLTGLSKFGQVIASTDDGLHWSEPANNGLPTQWARKLVATPRGTILAFAGKRNGGVYRSTDNGATWTNSTQGITNADVACVAIDSAQNVLACLPESGVYRSGDKGASWVKLAGGIPSGGSLQLRVSPSGAIFAADSAGGVFRSMDNGSTWTSAVSGLSSTSNSAFAISHLGSLLLATNQGVYRSTNNGDAWQTVAGSIPTSVVVSSIGERSDGFMLATTNFGPYISTDNGDHWNFQAGGLSVPECYGVCFANDKSIIMGNGGAIVRSTDDGLHWKKSVKGVVLDTFPFIQFQVRRNGRIIAARQTSIQFLLVSTDNGVTWGEDRWGELAPPQSGKDESTDLTVGSLAEDASGNLFAASNEGLWLDGSAAVVKNAPQVPSAISMTVAPNPANAVASISFTLGEPTVSRIALVDCLGRTVWSEQAVHRDAGEHKLHFNASQFPSGMYRCVLTTGSSLQSVAVGIVR